MVSGTVLERDGAAYRVLTADGEVRAVLRGKVKRDTPRVVVGDRVGLDLEGEGGMMGIAVVEERRSLLARRVPEGRGTRPVAAEAYAQFLAMWDKADPALAPRVAEVKDALSRVTGEPK